MDIIKGKRTKRTRHRPYIPIPSPQFPKNISVRTEEEEMANCLILLAQGIFPKQENKEDDKEEKYNKREKTTRISGFNKYNCKTSDRTFQSFQALGGHRASHKKPRIDPRKDSIVKIEDMKGQLSKIMPLAIKRTKVHKCPVCGSEFNSGQALGGHMRRHRAPRKGLNYVGDNKGIGFLAFDLNLPVLVEDDQSQLIEPEFEVRSKNHMYIFLGSGLD